MKNIAQIIVLILLFSNCSSDREENFQLASQNINNPTEATSEASSEATTDTSTESSNTSTTETSSSSENTTTTNSPNIAFDSNGTCVCAGATVG
ncbi:hypothetical protein N9541_07805, partial [Flavobacteriaceae bacterium]|nr:hypothetical protein [Flavobacteriaceae bacterium]